MSAVFSSHSTLLMWGKKGLSSAGFEALLPVSNTSQILEGATLNPELM